MKLSKTQLKIILLMNSGWELGFSCGIDGSWWIQKGGLGKGGESIHHINSRTIHKLIELKLVESNERHYPKHSYKLTKEGRKYGVKMS